VESEQRGDHRGGVTERGCDNSAGWPISAGVLSTGDVAAGASVYAATDAELPDRHAAVSDVQRGKFGTDTLLSDRPTICRRCLRLSLILDPSFLSYKTRAKIHRSVDLISDVLPFGRLWYTKPNDAVEYAKFYSRSHDAVIRVYDEAGKVIETHRHAGGFKEP
jgi:hypothetical protein